MPRRNYGRRGAVRRKQWVRTSLVFAGSNPDAQELVLPTDWSLDQGNGIERGATLMGIRCSMRASFTTALNIESSTGNMGGMTIILADENFNPTTTEIGMFGQEDVLFSAVDLIALANGASFSPSDAGPAPDTWVPRVGGMWDIKAKRKLTNELSVWCKLNGATDLTATFRFSSLLLLGS